MSNLDVNEACVSRRRAEVVEIRTILGASLRRDIRGSVELSNMMNVMAVRQFHARGMVSGQKRSYAGTGMSQG
jgi:hypothetical protein